MNVGILGSGDVGQTLGTGLVRLGNDVKIGSRDPQSPKLTAWLSSTGKGSSTGTFSDAASFGELVVLAIAWAGMENAIRLAKPRNLSGKVVIDTTNPLRFTSAGLPPALAVGFSDSAGERVQRWLPDARVVKAFNSIGSAHMVMPKFPGGPPDMPICGNDLAAKRITTEILTALGWGVIDVGGIESSRYLEPLAMIWIAYGFKSGSWGHSFKLLRK